MNVKRRTPIAFHGRVVEKYESELNSKTYEVGDDIHIIDYFGNKYLVESDIVDIIPKKCVRKVKKNGKKKANIKK